MKKLFTLLLTSFVLLTCAQAPEIEGTYFPVRNTKIKQIWDTIQGVINVPSMGPNQIWDYTQANGQFINVCDTFEIKVYDPAVAPGNQYFPNAAQAVFYRTPLPNDLFDSLYLFFHADPIEGLSQMGGYSIKGMYDSTFVINPRQYYGPPLMIYGFNRTDTSRSVGYVNNYNGFKAKIKSRRINNVSYTGYGTLKLPNHTYNNVAQIRDSYSAIDSIFVDLMNNGNYVFINPPKTSSGKKYNFYRNNTFGSAYLMYLNVNPANTIVEQAWYALPADIGSITGTVYTNTLETTPVTNGEVYLYRENSNFKRNDILAKSPLDAGGNYKFDSIPYGEYRFAVRSNTLAYPNAMITYLGDKTDWLQATTIITNTTTSTGHKIHLKYHSAPTGSNSITGQILSNPNIMRSATSAASKPVPSIGIVVKKNPGSTAARTIVTNSLGLFDLGPNLEDGDYTLFVDIPGLHMAGTYSISVLGGQAVTGLDYTVGTDSIHPFSSAVIGVKEINRTSPVARINAYPNPYTTNAIIEIYVPITSQITLEVFNLLGEKIQLLDNTQKENGIYTYDFSAKNLNYNPGVYFVKLTVGQQSKVIKLIEQ